RPIVRVRSPEPRSQEASPQARPRAMTTSGASARKPDPSRVPESSTAPATAGRTNTSKRARALMGGSCAPSVRRARVVSARPGPRDRAQIPPGVADPPRLLALADLPAADVDGDLADAQPVARGLDQDLGGGEAVLDQLQPGQGGGVDRPVAVRAVGDVRAGE